jgi:hypothetical protein
MESLLSTLGPVKSLTGNNDCSRTISSIEHNGNLVVDDIEKSELFNKFFCEQSTLDDSDHTPPDSFLNTGVTLANFHSDGKEDNDSDMLNNLHSGYFNIGAASRKSRYPRLNIMVIL